VTFSAIYSDMQKGGDDSIGQATTAGLGSWADTERGSIDRLAVGGELLVMDDNVAADLIKRMMPATDRTLRQDVINRDVSPSDSQ
jgi:hypothetical protein